MEAERLTVKKIHAILYYACVSSDFFEGGNGHVLTDLSTLIGSRKRRASDCVHALHHVMCFLVLLKLDTCSPHASITPNNIK